jgi:hypothetical protein
MAASVRLGFQGGTIATSTTALEIKEVSMRVKTGARVGQTCGDPVGIGHTLVINNP